MAGSWWRAPGLMRARTLGRQGHNWGDVADCKRQRNSGAVLTGFGALVVLRGMSWKKAGYENETSYTNDKGLKNEDSFEPLAGNRRACVEATQEVEDELS